MFDISIKIQNRLLSITLLICFIIPMTAYAQERDLTRGLFNGLQMSTRTLSDSVQIDWVRHYGTMQWSESYDFAKLVTTDSDGNIYVTGHSEGIDTNDDILTIKYNSEGVEEWHARYHKPEYDKDQPAGIAVDESGNVYVTGTSFNYPSKVGCYTTIKYNSNGVQAWVAEYKESEDDHAKAAGIAMDASGNVYVTGSSESSSLSLDFVTIKYRPDGTEEWIVRYDENEFGHEYAIGIVVDNFGNICVGGYRYRHLTWTDYLMVKYNSDGTEQWAASYDGPGSWYDEATGMAVDDSGNFYITGDSYSDVTGYDFTTVKYSADGNEEWVARYHKNWNEQKEAGTIVVDESENVYLVGNTDSTGIDNSLLAVKYNSNGEEQWYTTYGQAVRPGEVIPSIGYDSLGNVYVSGTGWGTSDSPDIFTLKYNTAGELEWANEFDGPSNDFDIAGDMVVNSSGSTVVVGRSKGGLTRHNFSTIRYNSDGEKEWVAGYSGPSASDNVVSSMIIDNSGNVIVAGKSHSPEVIYGYYTRSYKSDGTTNWISRYSGPYYGDNYITDLTIDNLGFIYVTGSSEGSETQLDYATIKYNAAGKEQWIAIYDGLVTEDDKASGIAVDDLGNVYVTGRSGSPSDLDNYATVKYNSNGIEEWIVRFGEVKSYDDYVAYIALDDHGNIYVTGASKSAEARYEIITVKYGPDGSEKWTVRYGGTGNYASTSSGIAIDDSGNVYVIGTSLNNIYSEDYVTIKYNADGEEQWVQRYFETTDYNDLAKYVRIDKSGYVVVTGESYSSETGIDIATIKYSPEGIEEWESRFSLEDKSSEKPTDIAIDESGNVYVSGTSFSSIYGYDFVTTKYNPNGEELWRERYDGPEGADDENPSIAIDQEDAAYVSGTTSTNIFSIFTIIKYIEGPVSVEDDGPALPIEYILLQNYPNPFNPMTTIRYSLKSDESVSLIVYNINGKAVTRLVDSEQNAGNYNYTWNASNFASGIYFYSLQAGDFVQTRKMILLK